MSMPVSSLYINYVTLCPRIGSYLYSVRAASQIALLSAHESPVPPLTPALGFIADRAIPIPSTVFVLPDTPDTNKSSPSLVRSMLALLHRERRKE